MAHYSSEASFRQPLVVPCARVHHTIMTERSHPSAVRVFGRSLYMLAAGWAASILWLWLVALRQHVVRFGTTPDDLAITLLVAGAIPAIALALLARSFGKFTGGAPSALQEKIEWRHAFWWALFPNVILLATAYLVIFGA